MVCRLSCSVACGISPDQGLNLCLLPWWVDSYPLCHQGSPLTCFNPEPLVLLKKSHMKGFPGGPVVWTLHFYCKGHEFNPWSGNSDSVSLVMQTKKKKSHTRSGLWKGKEVKQREIFETKIEMPLPWPPGTVHNKQSDLRQASPSMGFCLPSWPVDGLGSQTLLPSPLQPQHSLGLKSSLISWTLFVLLFLPKICISEYVGPLLKASKLWSERKAWFIPLTANPEVECLAPTLPPFVSSLGALSTVGKKGPS